MALIKEIENSYGVTFNYHKIGDVRILKTKAGTQLRITVESYLDKEARRNGKQPIKTEAIIEHAEFALDPFYALLKAKFPEFSGLDDTEHVSTGIEQPAEYFIQSGAKTIAHRKEELAEPEETLQPEETTEQEQVEE